MPGKETPKKDENDVEFMAEVFQNFVATEANGEFLEEVSRLLAQSTQSQLILSQYTVNQHTQ